MAEELEKMFLKLRLLIQDNDIAGVKTFLQDDIMVRRMANFHSCCEDGCYGWSDIFTLVCSSADQMDIAQYMVDKCVSVCGKRFLKHLLEALSRELGNLLAGEDVPVARRLITLGAEFKALTFFGNATLLHKVISLPSLNLDTLVCLLDQGASLTAIMYNGLTPLDVNFQRYGGIHHCAATVAILERTPQDRINAVSRNGESGVMQAAKIACPRCVKAFLERGADVSSAVSFPGLPVIQYLDNVAGESTEELEAFRKLLRCTDHTKLKYLASQRNPGVSLWQTCLLPLSCLVENRTFKYFDVIWEEGLQLLDFISAATCYTSLLDSFAVSFRKLPEPYFTEIYEVLLQADILSEFCVELFLATSPPNPRFILYLLHQGLVQRRKHISIDDLETLEWSGSLKLARRFIETMALLGELEIADNACLREARDRIEEEYTLDEDLQQRCSLLGSKVLTLKRLSSNAVRQRLYECHGQVALVPLVEQLNLPPVLADTILCRDIQYEEDDSSSSGTSAGDFPLEDDESMLEESSSLSEESADEDEMSVEDEALSED